MPADPWIPFLAQNGWGEAQVTPLAGDASNRRYSRLHDPDGRKAVFMDAPPSRGEDVRPFLEVAQMLSAAGLSAPQIYAADETQGWLVIEDLGDALFARVLAQDTDPVREITLYERATDVLVTLHRQPVGGDLDPYDSTTMPDLGALALDWYAHGGDRNRLPDLRTKWVDVLTHALTPFDGGPRVLVQRDYHAENLLWLPERSGVAQVGLLDFQDARLGHPAYDLVSLLEDARRDVAPATVHHCIDHYVDQTGADPDQFRAAYATMGAQRNLRILGVFARLSLHFGKPAYVDLIPRVWGHLQTDLAHPDLAALAELVQDLPQPNAEHLQDLKNRCGTVPTR